MALQTFNLYFKSSPNPLIVGRLKFDPSVENGELLFAYDEEWLRDGYALGMDLPLASRIFKTNRSHPYFGFLYDLIPGLGASKAAKRRFGRDLNPLELTLAAQDTLRPGALGFSTSFEIDILTVVKMLKKYDKNELGFKPKCSYSLLLNQYKVMGEYLDLLKLRADIEEVRLGE